MSDYMLEKEIDEAIASGEAALFSLKEAQNKLNSARNWGIFDMLGGGLISDIIKHSKMNDASAYLEEAKRDLLVFQRELQDVQGTVDLKVDVSEFLTFADFFFDGFIMENNAWYAFYEYLAQREDCVLDYCDEKYVGYKRIK